MTDHTVDAFREIAIPGDLKREIKWTHAVGVATGVPALVLFSIGAIATTVGSISWIVWVISVIIGSLQMFTYAEVVGMYSGKSGGAAISGSMAWTQYSKLVPAISAWNYWLAWTPVLAIGTSIAAGYILTAFFPADSIVNTWQLKLVDLGFIQDGLSLRINASYLVSAILLLVVYALQHGGILKAARLSIICAVASLVPLGIVGIVPLLTGTAPLSNLLPMVPLAHDAAGKAIPGLWNMAGFTVFIGGVGIAAWSSYGIEACLVYTREFKNPERDTFKAALATSLICLFFFAIVPISFQAFLGLDGLSDPTIGDGSGVAVAMAKMVSASPIILKIIVVMLIITLLLAVLTAMAGSSRCLYQASADGFLPKFLSHVNSHGAPTTAMATDLGFNLLLLLMSSNVFVLAVSNVCYLIFNFINLEAGWIHRLDRPDWPRPFKAPTWLLIIGAILGFVNLFFIGMGAEIFGAGVLKWGLITAFAVVPLFLFRHYVTDKGVFPTPLLASQPAMAALQKAGFWPYVTIAAGVVVVWFAHAIAVY